MAFKRWSKSPSKKAPERQWSENEMKIIGWCLNNNISISIIPDWKNDMNKWKIDIIINKKTYTDPNQYENEVVYNKVNEYYNKNWNVLGGTNHVKLQWQLLCVAGKTGKKQFHPWIGLKKKKDDSSKSVKLLAQIYPEMKMDEVETLARISTKKEIKELAKEHGYEKVDI